MNQNADVLSNTRNSPQQITPFIGREKELAELTQLLAEPACQLLTLVGPGGIGKTRLATAAARAHTVADDVYFVALQPVQNHQDLLPAIASALHLSLTGQISPATQIYQFLQDKEFLLLLDNFEHLLESADQISALLGNALRTKLLITSREVLNLQEEWLFPVPGMSLPPDTQKDESSLPHSDAVVLFAERARRVRHNFVLGEEYNEVVDICRLVEGMPLALELAAAWSKTMTCRTIAAEIRQNIDFLSTRLRNVPARHRSIQTIFDQSWQMLTADEQKIYVRLSVFRGGFRREAAEQVAEADLATLTGFVDRSLLHWNPSGRYQIHELLRQYAADRLTHTPDVLIDSCHAHCTYYAALLHQHSLDLHGGKQLEAAADIEDDLDNIRAAWAWALQHKRLSDLRQMLNPVGNYFQLRGRYLDGIQMLEMALAELDETDPAAQENLALLLVGLAWYALRLGQIERVQSLSKQSMAIYKRADLPLPLPDSHTTDPALTLGSAAAVLGHYDEAASYFQQALQRSQNRAAFAGNEQTARYQLAKVAVAQGDFATAQTHAQAAFAVAEKIQDHWFMAYCHLVLGHVAQQLGKMVVARHHFQAGYDLRETFGDAEGMAIALTHLGEIALHENDPTTARELYNRSITLFQQIHDPGGFATAYFGAAKTALALCDDHSACNFLTDALTITHEMAFVPLTLTILVEAGQLLADHEQTDEATVIFATVAHHPAVPYDVRERTPATDTAPKDLASIVALAQQALAALSETTAEESVTSTGSMHTSASASIVHQANQDLIEPLTPRELEVLHLMADGLTNQAIADHLIVVLGTVKAHTNNIYGKLGVRNRVEAVKMARERGLLDSATESPS